MKLKSICGVIISARNPGDLAKFYSNVFGVEIKEESHGELGIDIGEIHLGIHPPENIGSSEVSNSSILIAYNVDSLNQTEAKLQELKAKQVMPVRDEGFGLVATYKDPEGNHFEIVELNYSGFNQ